MPACRTTSKARGTDVAAAGAPALPLLGIGVKWTENSGGKS